MNLKISNIALSVATLAATLGGIPAATAQTVTLHYNSRPPYVVVQDGVLSGLTGSPAVAAFEAAGIPFSIADTPATRFILTVKDNEGLDCGVGWFKNPEREGFGKFTKPIYQDEPQIALTAAENTKLKTTDTVESVLSSKDLSLLVKQSYSYGKGLDALIEKLQPKRNSTSAENIQMFKMVQAKRSDYLFTAPEEAAVTIKTAGFQEAQFNLIKLGNTPKGELRYILCSKNVPDEVINKLNAVIK